jgi:hypothetical protein
MGNLDMDLYVNLKIAREKDKGMLDILRTKTNFIEKMPPLVKTKDKSEYENVIKNLFESK